MAFTLGLTRSICAMNALTTSVAESLRARMSRASCLAAPAAGGAGLAQHVRERLARALAGHLHQSERGEAVHRHAGAVARERLPEFLEHRGAMLVALHVDEVEDDDAAEVAQPQLAR